MSELLKASKMTEQLLIKLTSLGFEIQNTSYEHLIENDALNYLKSIDLPDNEASDIIKYFPHFFVMHKTINAAKGSFFVVLKTRGEDIPQKAKRVYHRYFPPRILVVSKDDSEQYYAGWLHIPGDRMPLGTFIKRDVGIG